MPSFLGLGHSAKIVLPGGVLVADSGVAVVADSARSAMVGVTTSKHLAFASRIATRVTDTRGATSVVAPTAGSSVVVGRTGKAVRSGA
jgi:hypothetical protein